MCDECNAEIDTVRPYLDVLIDSERATRQLFPNDTEQQHTVRLACTIADAFHTSGHDLKGFVLMQALLVQKLLAVQQVYGIPVI